jgi:prepilin-type N-terminal cleavage/methylation domain-containing protein/prepilin-type processing-associated H-X9-DG protein
MGHMGRRARGGRGFTLIELLVVIAIVAILATLIAAAAMRAIDAAESTQCRSNVGQFGKAYFMYCKDYEDFLPMIGGASDRYPAWYLTLGRYMHSYEHSRKLYTCPSKPQTALGYGVNVRFADPYSTTHCWQKTLPRGVVQNATGTIFIGDSGYPLVPSEPDPQKWKEDDKIGPVYPQRNGDGSPVQFKLRFPYHPGYGLYFTSDPSRPVPRHRGKCNNVMFDGSVNAYRPDYLLSFSYGQPGCLWDNE